MPRPAAPRAAAARAAAPGAAAPVAAGAERASSSALRVTAKSLPQHTRARNRSLVLQTLWHQGSMSRADLARESGLTRPTVSGIVQELADEGVVAELGLRGDSRVGKPATLVGIRPDSFHILALDLSSAERFSGAVVDVRGEVVGRASVDIDGATGEAAVALAERLVDELSSLTTTRLLGVGVGTPGIVDHQGVVRTAVHLGWWDLPLAARLSARTGVPVHVGNDANLAALGVHTFGDPERDPSRSLMVITIEHGVGVGLIVGGALVEGDRFSAGEIGHVTVDEAGDVCACGRRGCLEVSLAAPGLSARLLAVDPGSRGAVLHAAGRDLGFVLAPVVSALGLDEVVLSGPRELLDGVLLRAAVETVRARTLAAVGQGLVLRYAGDDRDLAVLGAASLVLSAELGVS